jgi:hypothetical protein
MPITPAPDGSILKLWDRFFNRKSLPAGVSSEDLPWILSCHSFLTYSQTKESLVPNHVLVALICSGILSKAWWEASRAFSTSEDDTDTHGPLFDTALTRADVHLGAQLETTLFCLFLLGLIHTSNPDSRPDMAWTAFWSRLDLRILYKCLELARGGKLPEQILDHLLPRQVPTNENHVPFTASSKTTKEALPSLAVYYNWEDLILEGVDVTETIDPVLAYPERSQTTLAV